MARYIDADKALKLIKEQKEKETGAYSKGRNIGLNIARSIINNPEVLPTADVVEVKHGEWKDNKCSICGEISPTIYLDEYEVDYKIKETPFCPNCGAKMDGGAE